jgi:peptidoglycan/xylan/chitin deacetylase (PgdA/CDA1 family)
MYHRIGRPNPKSLFRGHYVAPKQFENHLKALALLHFEVVSLSEALNESSSKRRVVITFDDGYRNLVENAFPPLIERGYPATVFLVANQIGGYNAWDADNGDVTEPLLNLEDIRLAKSRGIDFGSHTLNHVDLSAVSKDEAQREIYESRELLEQKLGQAPRFFCYPYGRQASETRQMVREAGYELACSTRKGTLQDDAFALKRINVRRDSTLPLFVLKLYRGLIYDR